MQVNDLETETIKIEQALLQVETIKIEQTLLQVEKVKIDFSPVLFIRRTMETAEGER
jgi:hypothetical protein